MWLLLAALVLWSVVGWTVQKRFDDVACAVGWMLGGGKSLPSLERVWRKCVAQRKKVWVRRCAGLTKNCKRLRDEAHAALIPSKAGRYCKTLSRVLLVCSLLFLTTATATGVGETTSPAVMQTASQFKALCLEPIAEASATKPAPPEFSTSSVNTYVNLPLGDAPVRSDERYEKDDEGGWIWGNHRDFSLAQKNALQQVVRDRRDSAFAYSMADLTGYTGSGGPMRIHLEDESESIFERPRKHSVLEYQVQDDKCQELDAQGIIGPAPSDCRFASNVTMPVKKDAQGRWTDKRMCVDLRNINAKTKNDRYGMLSAEEVFQMVGNSVVFSKIDLRAGYHQLPIAEEDQPKTAFWWRKQLFMYKRTCFGLKTASQKFQKTIDDELRLAGLTHCASAYIDDVLIYSQTPEEHVQHVAAVLDALSAVGLKAHPDKSVFGAECLEYLGHNISKHGLTPHEAKIATIQQLKSPNTVSELRAVLGFLSYYRSYCPNFSALASPMNDLLKKDAPWEWSADCELGLKAIKDSICMQGRGVKLFDVNKKCTLYTDWSAFGIGAVLSQGEGEEEYIVACISRSLNKHERNYCSYEGELLAVVWACRTLRPYLHNGNDFTIITDHRPLQWLMANRELQGKHARWALIMQEFDFQIVHRPGTAHANADIPSRFPLPDTLDTTGARLDDEEQQAAAFSMAAVSTVAASTHCEPQFLDLYQHLTQSYQDQVQVAEVELQHAACAGFMDSFAPYGGSAIPGHAGYVTDLLDMPPDSQSSLKGNPLSASCRQKAKSAVLAAADKLVAAKPVDTHPIIVNEPKGPDQHGVHETTAIDTSIVTDTFMPAAQGDGITLWEMFGGMGAGLEMVLRNGFKVRRYLYSDISPDAQEVMKHRLIQLAAKYPQQIDEWATERAFIDLPMDVLKVTTADLLKAGIRDGSQWMVVAGWECQAFSTAGLGLGLDDPTGKADTYFAAKRVIGSMQQLLKNHLPLGYILENAPMQFNQRHLHISQVQFPRICRELGTPVVLDAARVGSRAHRLRNYWTNLADANALQTVIDGVKRPDDILASDILEEGVTIPRLAPRDDLYPFYPCNKAGAPLSAFPTFVAYPLSNAYKAGALGSVIDERLGEREPLPIERERALGYDAGSTAAPGLSQFARHQITGRCIDANAAEHLLAWICALYSCGDDALLCASTAHATPVWGPQLPAISREQLVQSYSLPALTMLEQRGWRAGTSLGTQGSGHLCHPIDFASRSKLQTDPPDRRGVGYPAQRASGAFPAPPYSQPPSLHLSCYESIVWESQPRPVALIAGAVDPDLSGQLQQEATATATEIQEPLTTAVSNSRDIWRDHSALAWITRKEKPPGCTSVEHNRLRRRCQGYEWEDPKLFRVMADSSRKQVPHPDRRTDLIMQVHKQTGHFGQKRTLALLLNNYWWAGMGLDVAAVLSSCASCNRVRSHPAPTQAELQPLPIKGMFYRWGVDMAGPFPSTTRGNRYVLIMIEHFSKQIEVVPLPDKIAIHTAFALLQNVICRYGSPAEVITDQGTEFKGAFDDLLQQNFIEHRTTSAYHPQADGLAERAVQTVKRALRKHCEDARHATTWDTFIPWLLMGYNCSPQASTKQSPYKLLYGTDPVLPPATREVLQRPLDFQDEEECSAYILARTQALRDNVAMAMSNLKIAQQKDKEQYRRRHSGEVKPKLRQFKAGDFVYRRRQQLQSTLQVKYRPEIYKVVEVRPSGVIVLQGRCGTTFPEHGDNLAFCFLPNVDDTIDPTLAIPEEDFPCSICAQPKDPHCMALCDHCGKGYHDYCIPDQSIPEMGNVLAIWVCGDCLSAGVTVEAVQARRATMSFAPTEPIIFPSKQQRVKDEEAAALNGRAVWAKRRSILQTGSETEVVVHGILEYLGRQGARNPKYFLVRYDDGTSEQLTLAQARKRLVDTVDVPAGLSAIDSTDQAAAVFQELTGCSLSPSTMRHHDWMQTSAYMVTACPIRKNQLDPLLTNLDLSYSFTALCLTLDNPELVQQLSSRGVKALLRRSRAFLPPLDRPLEGGLDLVLMSPPHELVCLMLPYFTAVARQLVCCLVPGKWWNTKAEKDTGFRSWFDSKQRAGLAKLITTGSSIWLIASNSIAAMEKVWSHRPDPV
jgi:transposase InsO family protein